MLDLAQPRILRLRKLKEYIEGKREEREEALEELTAAVERMKERERAPVVETPAAVLLRKRLEGAPERKLDFSKISFKKGFLKRVYPPFEKPLSALALYLSRTPLAAGLTHVLERAGIVMTPEAFLVTASVVTIGSALAVFLFTLGIGLLYNDSFLMTIAPLLALITGIIVSLLPFLYLYFAASSRAKKIDRVLPFALRQIATQVRAGVSFHSAIISVANSSYGVLSEEFQKLNHDLEKGLSTEDAFVRLYNRTNSQSLRKTITQILRSFKTGGSLSQIISDIAQDVSFETRMSIRDFTEKLNFLNVIFIMVAVVAPVAATILSAIMQIPLFAAALPGYFIYTAFFAIILAMFALLYVTKQMEPAAW